MKLRRLLAALGMAAVLMTGVSTTAMAAEPSEPAAPVVVAAAIGGGTAEPQSDIIETKFRTTADGGYQYRRWNATRGYWVDPYWIDIPIIRP